MFGLKFSAALLVLSLALASFAAPVPSPPPAPAPSPPSVSPPTYSLSPSVLDLLTLFHSQCTLTLLTGAGPPLTGAGRTLTIELHNGGASPCLVSPPTPLIPESVLIATPSAPPGPTHPFDPPFSNLFQAQSKNHACRSSFQCSTFRTWHPHPSSFPLSSLHFSHNQL